jgi:bifunctional ADP-heptose synthase (sugar kinase/adenylyltransferase)
VAGPLLADALAGAGTVLVSDYGRGVCALPELVEVLARVTPDVPVVWDPHPRGGPPVAGCAVVTPNLAEARTARPPASRPNCWCGAGRPARSR